jgi:uncharacterized hydrophobic protein (TIGR00271 family)
MLHLRLIVPSKCTERAIERLYEHESVTNVVVLPDAAQKPPGDVVLCDVALEDASIVLRAMEELGVARVGSIAVERLEASISTAAKAAESAADGSPSDAVVWEAVEEQTSSSAELTLGYLLLVTIATAIAAVGILTDSVVLIIGAMVVGPEYGPMAGVSIAAVERRPRLALRSCVALVVGFAVAIVTSYAGVLVLSALGLTPVELVHRQTMFIWRPDVYSVLIALLAGVAGMLSVTTSKSGTLIGVFISVTTIPAAANIAVAAAYGLFHELAGSAMQLVVNMSCIIGAGILTLVVQRLAFVRRLSRAARRQARRRGWQRARTTLRSPGRAL